MQSEQRLFPELERLLASKTTTKKEVNDFLWLLEYPDYEHKVVDIRTFIESEEYLNAGKECWDSIKEDLEELFRKEDPEELFGSDYNEAVFCEAIGAGKSYKSSIIITYMVYKMLCLKDPQKSYGLAKGSLICLINMSIRAGQSKKVMFGEITARIDNSPWFSKFYPPDPNTKSELRFPKNIIIFPGNSKEDFPLGYNIFGGIMDEASFLIDTETHNVAEQMYNAIHNRIKNRFGDSGILVMISSPRYIDDFIETKMKEAESNKKIFARRKKLWESKPASYFSGKWIDFDGYKIPAEFETESKRNPEAFKRDYMAIPSLALEPYVKEWESVKKAVDLNMEVPVDEHNRFKDWFRGKPNHIYYGHIDLALTTDATGISFCHKEGETIIVDLIMRIKAPQGKEIDIAEVRAVVYEMKARGFSIGKCTFDQFQSASSIQEFNKMGINSERLSIDLSCYATLKEGINTGKVKFYRNEDFLMELKRLELIEGKRIDHPRQGSKDLVDAVAGAVYNCITAPEFSYGFAGGGREPKTPEEAKKEAETLSIDSLVTYGYWQNRRPY